MEHGDASIYGCDLEVPNIAHVRFVNDNGNVFATATRANAAEKSVRGSGNEGSSAAFLYKRMAILVPLTEDAGTFLIEWRQVFSTWRLIHFTICCCLRVWFAVTQSRVWLTFRPRMRSGRIQTTCREYRLLRGYLLALAVALDFEFKIY